MSSGRKEDDAVSPVIGVMLMLVIVLIIAAVISVAVQGISVYHKPDYSICQMRNAAD